MAFCKECGTKVDGAFCPNCGTPVKAAPAPAAPSAPAAPKSTGGFFSAAGNLDGSPKKVPVEPASVTPVTPPVPKPVVPVTPPVPKPVAPVTPPVPKPVVPVTPPVAPPPTPVPRVTPPEPAPRTDPPKPAPRRPHRRISAGRELKVLLRQGFLVLTGEKRNLIISLLFPFLAAAITVWIAGKDMFITAEGTRSACFVLVCAAIWCGLFNSIQTIVKERSNIKRDYVSGALRIECYMASRAIIQTLLCLFQSLILTLSIPVMAMGYEEVKIPAEGLLGGSVFLEFYISLFLVMLASDAMGLMISSFVKKEEVASKLAPYILIAQLLFSGVLFALKGAANTFSVIMISRWGMGALGSICDLNHTPTGAYLDSGDLCAPNCMVREASHYMKHNDSFNATEGNLLGTYFVMILFVVVSLVGANILLHRVKKDGRD